MSKAFPAAPSRPWSRSTPGNLQRRQACCGPQGLPVAPVDRRRQGQRRTSRSSAWQRVESLPRGAVLLAVSIVATGPRARTCRRADRRRQRPGCRGPSPRRSPWCRSLPGKLVIGLVACHGPQGSHVAPVDRRRQEGNAGQAGHRPGNVSRAFPRGRARGVDRRRGPGSAPPIVAGQAGHRPGSVSRAFPRGTVSRSPWCRAAVPVSPIDAGQAGHRPDKAPRSPGLARAAHGADRRRQGPGCRGPSPAAVPPIIVTVPSRRARRSSAWQRVAVPPAVPIDAGNGRAVEGLPAAVPPVSPIVATVPRARTWGRVARGADHRRRASWSSA